MSNYYLAHHGILGQKWGKKNGPPYPLDYKKLSEEERAKAKESAIRRGDVKEAQFNRDYFTDQEVKQVMERFDLNQKLSNVADPAKQSNFEKIENFVNKADRTAKMIDKGTDVWNTVAKISNGLGLLKPNELPVIDKRDPWNKPKEKEKTIKKTEFYDLEDGKATRTKWVETDSDGNSKTFNVINKNKDTSSSNDNKTSTKNDNTSSSNDNKTSTTNDNSSTNSTNSSSNETSGHGSAIGIRGQKWTKIETDSNSYTVQGESWVNDYSFLNSKASSVPNYGPDIDALNKEMLNKNISDLDNYFNNKK